MSEIAYGIDAGALRAHAGRVAECAGAVHEAAGAGATTIDGSAFGILCSPLALPVGVVTAAATAAIAHVADQLDTMAGDVRAMAGNYDSAEADAQTSYTRAKRDFSTVLG